MEKLYATPVMVKRVIRELNKLGLKGFARKLREKQKVTFEELSQYQAKICQLQKEKSGVVKTQWEKKIVDRIGHPNGRPTPDYQMMENEELSKILIKESPEWKVEYDDMDGDLQFGFYTYMGEVCVLVVGLDCDFDSFPEVFQKKFWELIEAGKYKKV